MDQSDGTIEPASANASGKTRWRLKALVAAHLLASTALVSEHFIPGYINYLPLMWSVASLWIAQSILLAFWAGMANQSAILRFAGAAMGVLYLASWRLLGAVAAPRSRELPTMDVLTDSIINVAPLGAVVLVFTAIFWAARRWVVDLRLTSAAERASQPEHYQFSIRRVLIITTVAAVVLAMMRSKSDQVLDIVAFIINAVCAAWAALAIGPVKLRLGLVLCLAVLLGAAVAFEGMRSPGELPWWLSPAFAAFMVLPSVIIVASLLVARSCGYRLVARQKTSR